MSFEQWYLEIPIVTRCYLTASVLTTAACYFDIVSPFSLYLNYRLIFEKYEFWRILTNFFFFGMPSLDFVFHMYFLVRYCRLLEEVSAAVCELVASAKIRAPARGQHGASCRGCRRVRASMCADMCVEALASARASICVGVLARPGDALTTRAAAACSATPGPIIPRAVRGLFRHAHVWRHDHACHRSLQLGRCCVQRRCFPCPGHVHPPHARTCTPRRVHVILRARLCKSTVPFPCRSIVLPATSLPLPERAHIHPVAISLHQFSLARSISRARSLSLFLSPSLPPSLSHSLTHSLPLLRARSVCVCVCVSVCVRVTYFISFFLLPSWEDTGSISGLFADIYDGVRVGQKKRNVS